MNNEIKFEYKVLGDVKKIKGKKLLGIFTTRHSTNYSKKVIKEVVYNFSDSYCFMLTYETYCRLGLHDCKADFILILDDIKESYTIRSTTIKVYLKNEISDMKLKFLYKDLFISNKSDNVLILEATKFSKNLNILALYAQELGKDVFVLPGRIDSDSSEGANKLIFDGASPLYTLDLLKI
jgi:hypothetical protein